MEYYNFLLIRKKLKKKTTTKLFYNRYLFSLNCVNPMTAIFRNKNLRWAKSVIDNMQRDYQEGLPIYLQNKMRKKEVSVEAFNDVKTFFNEFSTTKEDYKLRCEGNSFHIYSNNKIWLKNIQKKIKCDKEFFEPDPKTIDFLKNNLNTIIVKDNKWGYKCTFNYNKVPQSFATWIERNPDKVKITDTAIKEIKNNGWINGRVCYLKDDSILMLCNLMASGCFNRIDKLVCRQNIDK
mgnify:CR=1 FL=1|tara:strand:- start:1371 stop:2078 length:708 start_codon:yes stop_codon:yes gene_type:complete